MMKFQLTSKRKKKKNDDVNHEVNGGIWKRSTDLQFAIQKKKKRKNDEVKHEVNGCMMKSIMKSRGA